MNTETDSLHNRLNRIQGQIEALKSAVDNPRNVENCQQVLLQLKAARNGLKKVGDLYITQSIDACMHEEESQEEKRDKIEEMLKTALEL